MRKQQSPRGESSFWSALNRVGLVVGILIGAGTIIWAAAGFKTKMDKIENLAKRLQQNEELDNEQSKQISKIEGRLEAQQSTTRVAISAAKPDVEEKFLPNLQKSV